VNVGEAEANPVEEKATLPFTVPFGWRYAGKIDNRTAGRGGIAAWPVCIGSHRRLDEGSKAREKPSQRSKADLDSEAGLESRGRARSQE
jgi:hypothetical protein